MWIEMACDALGRGRVLELQYDGYSRCIEVHAVGWTREGKAVMRGWQISGGSVSGERTGWKLMRLDEASGAYVSNQASHAPREGYKRDDAAMQRIACQL